MKGLTSIPDGECVRVICRPTCLDVVCPRTLIINLPLNHVNFTILASNLCGFFFNSGNNWKDK